MSRLTVSSVDSSNIYFSLRLVISLVRETAPLSLTLNTFVSFTLLQVFAASVQTCSCWETAGVWKSTSKHTESLHLSELLLVLTCTYTVGIHNQYKINIIQINTSEVNLWWTVTYMMCGNTCFILKYFFYILKINLSNTQPSMKCSIENLKVWRTGKQNRVSSLLHIIKKQHWWEETISLGNYDHDSSLNFQFLNGRRSLWSSLAGGSAGLRSIPSEM